MLISNGAEATILYRLQASEPDIVIVQCGEGFIDPGQSVMVKVVLRPLADLGPELEAILMNKEVRVDAEIAFAINEESLSDPRTFWDTAPPTGTHLLLVAVEVAPEKKVRIADTPPASYAYHA